jgi:transposase
MYNNIKMDHKETVCESIDKIELVQYRLKWQWFCFFKFTPPYLNS